MDHAANDQELQRQQSQETTTIKKLQGKQTNLYDRCSKLLEQVNEGMLITEQKVAKEKRQYTELVKEVQQAEYQLETLLVKYAMLREMTLGEIFNLTAKANSARAGLAR